MRTLYVEGVAIHDGPESCVASVRASAKRWQGYVWAGLLSREMCELGVPTLSHQAEGHARGGDIASRRGTLRGQRTWARTESPCARTGRSRGRPRMLVMPRPGWFAGWRAGARWAAGGTLRR
jgi:hypothetical protein